MNRKQRRSAARSARVTRSSGSPAPRPERLLAAATRHRETGRLEQAATLYRRVIAAEPAQSEALHWLGVLEQAAGRSETALGLLERAAASRTRDPLCLHHLGEVQRALGRHGDAVATYRRALAQAPGRADVHYGLGSALFDLGRTEEAAEQFERAVAISPGDAEAHNDLANSLAELGRADEAIAHYRVAVKIRPDFAEAKMNLGIALAQSGDNGAAELSYRDALAANPAFIEARLQLARFLVRRDRIAEAVDVLREAVRREPDHAGTHIDLGRCLVKLGRPDEALDHYTRALEIRPDLAEAHFNAGVCLQSIGRFDEAVAAHRHAVSLRPDLAEAHYNLSLIQDRRQDKREVTRLEAQLANPGLPVDERINLNFALAGIFDAGGEADRAFEHYRQGNGLKAQTLNFDPTQYVGYIDRLITTYDADFFEARPNAGAASGTPVFIVGMPRSGTTLTEQILASHPAVHGAGELEDIRRMVESLSGRPGGGAPFPECALDITSEAARELGEEYLSGLSRRSADAERVTDKMTGTYLRLGLIAQILPGARVIHCRRNPIDTCLSCYSQNFADGLSFTYDLTHLGLVYRQYERLMEHWRRVLRLPILDLDYEELIADQEAVSRRIVAFCDLPWDRRCLDFHRETRQVRTASFWQVRQPIYASSVGRWRQYASHLGPLIDALGDRRVAAS